MDGRVGVEREGAGRPGAGWDELRVFTWKVLIVALIGGLLFVTWQVADALLLVFAGVLLAILLLRATGGVRRVAGLSQAPAFGIVLAVLAAVTVAGFWFMGSTLAAQFTQLSDQLAAGIKQLPDEVRSQITDGSLSTALVSRLRTAATGLMTFLADVVVVVFAGIYLAASPDLYRRGLVLLVPPSGHDRAREVLDATGEALWKWLIGQLISMALVGILTYAALLTLGIPAALALAVVAALLEFIPLIGPILAALPAILIGFAVGPETALWVAGAYLLIQQVEGNLIQPLVQKRVVSLPPVITIAAVVAAGTLFGVIGMFLAAPLAVVTLVLVNFLYVRDSLGERPRFPE